MASADLTAQEHFVQLEYCLIVVGATLSSACSRSLNDGGEKGKVGLCYLGYLPLPWNSSLRTAHHALWYFYMELRTCSSAFVYSFIKQSWHIYDAPGTVLGPGDMT